MKELFENFFYKDMPIGKHECIVLDADDNEDHAFMENGDGSNSNNMKFSFDAKVNEVLDIPLAQLDRKSSSKLISSGSMGTKQTSLQAFFECSKIESSIKYSDQTNSTPVASSSATSSRNNKNYAVEEADCDDSFIPSSKKLPHYKRIAGRRCFLCGSFA